MSNRDRIDTHQHIVPPAYGQWLRSKGSLAGGLPIPDWTEGGALALMDASDIASAIVSVSTPGVYLDDVAEARDQARRVNEFSAELVHRRPERFGFFASLSLPDVEGAIAEARYALTELKADGVVMLANVNGTYLGDPAWMPLMEELNRHKAVVFIHPSALPGPALAGVPPFVADFLLDTTRAAIQYAQSGALERFPELKVILSHAGGFIPYAAERVARICSPDGQNEGGLARLRQFYFDTALSGSPYALPSLLAFADPGRITFGSDWPHATHKRSLYFTDLLDRYPMSDSQRTAIDRGNARKLLSRLG